MTRKHFTAIAESFRIQLADDRNDRATIERIVDMLCGDFKRANTNFNRDRFLEACGL